MRRPQVQPRDVDCPRGLSGGGEERASRRVFLVQLAAGLALPALLQGCHSQSPSTAERSSGRRDESQAAPDPQRPVPPTAEPTIRVRLGLSPTKQEDIRIGAARSLLLVGPEGERTQSLVLRGPITIRWTMRGWSITDSGGMIGSAASETVLTVSAMDAESQPLEVDGRRYPGTFRLVPRTEDAPGAFDIVNSAPLEAYLPGVVAKELYHHWKFATRAAQAVAARSFACCEIAWFGTRRHFDVSDSQSSQAYVGVAGHEPSVEAVRATRGVVLHYENFVVPGYYSACCGGVAARAVDVIGPNPINDVPPLHGHTGRDPCTEAPLYRWAIEQPLHALTRRINAFGRAQRRKDLADLSTVVAIDIADRNTHGRPSSYLVRDSARAEVLVAAEELRRAVDYTGQGLAEPKRRLWSSNVQVEIGGDAARFNGSGHGHGAGMCQYGAEAMARAGESHEGILRWYYPGATLHAAYS